MTSERPPPIVFLAFANDRDDRVRYLRNLAEEARRLRQALADAERAGLCQVVVRQNATVGEIFDLFQDARFRNRVAVFHYGGHANSYQLLFEGAAGEPAPADAAGFAAFLGHQTGLQLAFLNGCSTQRQAQGLLDAGVAVVVATSQAIGDAAATEFATRFYTGLAGGAPIGTAFGEAQAALRAEAGALTRHLGAAKEGERLADDRLPWELHVRPGAEAALDWNLPAAANNPLFGLPPLPKLDLPPTPYRHLEWFRREDAEIFFGRGREIAELYRRVTAVEGDPIILFYGQSGVGKSSVLAAGLLPRLEGSHQVRYVRRDQARGLTDTLAALAAADANSLADAWRRAEEEAGRPRVVVLDQVEEVFTRPNPDLPDELERFLDALTDLFADPARRPQGRLILGFRKEWLAEIEKRLEERRLPRAKVFLERLSRGGIVEVVAGPARAPRLRDRYGLLVAPELPNLIADDLLADRESPVAPMLQILLTAMWEAAKARDYDHPAFAQGLYDEFRKKGLGLNDFLARQLQALHDKQRPVVESGLALDLLAYHTTPLGTAEERAMAELEQTYRHQAEALPGLVQECRDLYLLVDPSRNQPDQPPASRLTHDTLAPHVRVRFDESDAPGQRARRILESRAVDWEEGKEGTPLDDADLKVVAAGADGMRAWLEDEERLIQASIAARNQREEERRRIQAEREESQRREQAEREARIAADARAQQANKYAGTLRRRGRWLAAALAGAIVLAIAAGYLFNDARANEQKARVAEATAVAAQAETERLSRAIRADQLTANALKVLDASPPLALLLAVEGLRTQSDYTTTVVIAEPVTTEATIPITHTVVVSETVVASAQANMHEVLGTVILGVPLVDHTEPVNAVAFSPDGRWLATASDDSTARLWDVANPWAKPITLVGHAERVNAVAFDPKGRWLVTGSDDNTARLWDLENPRATPIVLVDHTGPVRAVEFSPDGLWLVTASDDHTARLWNLESPRPKLAMVLADHSEPVVAVAFSPDCDSLPEPAPEQCGHWLATASFDNTARLWNMDDLQQAPVVLDDHESWVGAVAFSPNGRWLVTGSSDNTARLWDMRNLESGSTIVTSHTWPVLAVAFSSNGRWLATAGDNTVRLCDADKSWATSGVLRGHGGTVTALAFSPDGNQLATASTDGTALLWDVQDSAAVPTLLAGHEDDVWALAFSPDGEWLATASDDKMARLWAIHQRGVDPAVLHAGPGPAHVVAFSPDGGWLATGAALGTARLWDVTNPRAAPIELVGHDDNVVTLAFSPKCDTALQAAGEWCGRWLATGSHDKTVRLWNLEIPEVETIELAGSPLILKHVVFSPNGRWLAAVGDDAVRLWDMTNPEAPPEELAADRHFVDAAAFSPNGRWLTTASSTNAWLWDVTNRETAPILLAAHANVVSTVAFSPDGRWVATGSVDETVRLWQVENPKAKPIVLDHERSVTALAFSRDGHWLAAAGGLTVRLWDMWNLGAPSKALAGPNSTQALAFSPDSRWLAVPCSMKRVVCLWDVTNPATTPVMLAGHAGEVVSLAFSPDGRRLATASEDNTARLWNWRVEDLLDLACRMAGRNLSQTEWAWYFGDEAYRKTCEQWPKHSTVVQPLVESLIQQVQDLARAGNIEGAVAKLKEAQALDPSLNFDPRLAVQIEYGMALFDQGRMTESMAALDATVLISPTFDITGTVSANVWNRICRHGSISGEPAAMLPACERAVTLAPEDGAIRDSRGLARALTGDAAGAIADFEFALAWAEQGNESEDFITSRQAWIAALKAGQNPFNEATLQQLRNE